MVTISPDFSMAIIFCTKGEIVSFLPLLVLVGVVVVGSGGASLGVVIVVRDSVGIGTGAFSFYQIQK